MIKVKTSGKETNLLVSVSAFSEIFSQRDVFRKKNLCSTQFCVPSRARVNCLCPGIGMDDTALPININFRCQGSMHT